MRSTKEIENPLFTTRLRRLRQSPATRDWVRETILLPQDLIAPLFIIEGKQKRERVLSLPGIERLSIDEAIKESLWLAERGVRGVALFPVIDPSLKTETGEEGGNPNGLMAKALKELREKAPSLCIIGDVALDPFTTHGHDGIVGEKGTVLNDETVESLVQMALMQAEAGAHFVAPSDMMDGRVFAIRKALDARGFFDVGIISYSAKYASSLYGPFRHALGVQLAFGDKKNYQMDPANVREALFEAKLDDQEGADILLVKPALFYLDVIARLRQQTHRPIAAYHVSGEYAMVMAAHEKGWLDARAVFAEALLSIKRAGADLIFTYAAKWVL